jgi:hypothetical protein
MMRKILRAFADIVVVVAALALVFGIGYYVGSQSVEPEEVIVEKEVEKVVDLELPGEVEKRIVTVDEVESKLSEISELATYSGYYTVTRGKDETRYVLEDVKIPGTTNSIAITANGIVKVGYDVSQINIKIDDDKIYLSLPQAQLLDNYVIWDSIESTENNNVLNPIEISQYEELIDEIETLGLEDVESKGIYDGAEENLKTLIEGFLSEFEDYEIEYM